MHGVTTKINEQYINSNVYFVQYSDIKFLICPTNASWWGNRRERDHCEDLGVDGWIILGRISRRWDVGIWTGLGWPGIGTGGGRLSVRK